MALRSVFSALATATGKTEIASAACRNIFAGNALRFLGLDGEDTRQVRRLKEFYRKTMTGADLDLADKRLAALIAIGKGPG